MSNALRHLLFASLSFSMACGGSRPSITRENLHQTCPQAGCATGQECLESASSTGTERTCEIRCTSDAECPDTMKCNLPPIVPGSVQNTCVDV